MYELQVALRCRTSTVIPSNEVPSYLEPARPDAPKIQNSRVCTAQSTKYHGTISSEIYPESDTVALMCPFSVHRSSEGSWTAYTYSTVRLTTNLTGEPRVACPTGYRRGSRAQRTDYGI